MLKKSLFAGVLSILLAAGDATSEVRFSIEGTGFIYEVSDGDTLWVNVDNRGDFLSLYEESGDRDHFRVKYQSVKMRLGNINTGESNHMDKSKNTHAGMVQSQTVKAIAEKKRVKFHCWDIGIHNRPICSVDVDGVGDLGLAIIRLGFSRYVTRFGKSPRMHSAYAQAAAN